MRMTHLARSWGFVMAMSLCFGITAMPVHAEQSEKQGVSVTLTNVSLKTVIGALAKENGLKLIFQTDEDPVIELVNIPELTPVETIISNIAHSAGLEAWQEGDTWYVGKRRLVEVKPVIDPIPTTPVKTTPPQVEATPYRTSDPPATAIEPEKPSIVRKIELEHTAVREIMFMLGQAGYDIKEKDRRRTALQRVGDYISEQRGKVKVNGDDTSSSSPWLSGVLGRRSSSSDAYQFPGNPFPPINLPPTNPPAAQPPANQPPGNQPGQNQGANSLKDFVPKGIKTIVGLIGLNALLVRAETEDDIDQLVQLIKLIDQPVKQVIVEVMFVDMSVKDAISIGASWEYAGMPISATSLNGGSDGNFILHYIKGNIRATLSTLLSNSRSKVVNAPRLIIPNNYEGGYIYATTSIPFVLMNEETDVFGRTITSADVVPQIFQQGMEISTVTIHPDDSVTLKVIPQMETPTVTGVPVPGGGSGEIFGSTTLDLDTIVRAKSGETVMMGGFVSKNELQSGTRTPLLSNLPVIGPLLFGSRQSSVDNTETLIFVTPTIMKDDTTNFGGMGQLPPLF